MYFNEPLRLAAEKFKKSPLFLKKRRIEIALLMSNFEIFLCSLITCIRIVTLFIIRVLHAFANPMLSLKSLDRDQILICEVSNVVTSTVQSMETKSQMRLGDELQFWNCLQPSDNGALQWGFSDQKLFEVVLPSGRGRALTLDGLKEVMTADRKTVIEGLVTNIKDLFYSDDTLLQWSVFNLCFPAQDQNVQLQRLSELCDLYAQPIQSQRTLQDGTAQQVILPTLVERLPAQAGLSDGDFLEHVRNSIHNSHVTLQHQLSALGDRVTNSKDKAFPDQATAYEYILNKYRANHHYYCELIVIMLVIPPNASPVERLFSTAKHIKSAKRNCLHDKKFEALTLMGKNMPPVRDFPMSALLKQLRDKSKQ